MKPGHLPRWLLGGVFFWHLASAGAHPAVFTSVQVYIQPDGNYQLFTSFDLLAFALGKTSVEVNDPSMNALLDGPPAVLAKKLIDSREVFLNEFEAQTDCGLVTTDEFRFPTLGDVEAWKAAGRAPRLPVVARVEARGSLPPTASWVQFRFPVALGTAVLSVERPGAGTYDEPVNVGSASGLIQIQLESVIPKSSPAPERTVNRWQAWRRYIVLGITHIIPNGGDHICFVLGLFLAARYLSFLLWQITVFTLAHSITLALCLYGTVEPPVRLVEPCIAASIIFIGVENLRHSVLSCRRLLVVFGFGLVHGLGFDDALRNTGLPQRDFLTALVGFNFGVELGQCLVILAAFYCVGWLRGSARYRRWVIIPGSLFISCVAMVWFVQRVFPPWLIM